MGQLLQNDETGELVWLNDQGQIQSVEEPGLMAQAGRQFADIGSGVKYAYGQLTDNDALVNAARAETAERNRLFAPADEAFPYQYMIGQAIPGLATAPMGGFMTNIALGAGESALDLGEGGDMGSRALAGGAGAFLGDMAGRSLGRIMGMAKGAIQDMTGIRSRAKNPAAQAFEDQGGQTLAYQRMEQGTPAQRLSERMAQGMEASLAPSTAMREVMDANDDLFRARAIEAVGLDPARYSVLSNQFVNDALDHFQDGFSDIARVAGQQGSFDLPDVTADMLKKLPEIRELNDLGDFDRLFQANQLTGDEWMAAREALSEAASTRYQNGRSRAGKKILDMIDALDADMGRHVPNDYLPQYARLREQYKNFTILEKPNVISNDGQINVRTLRSKLDSRNQGYGRTATGGGDTTNDETRRLIDLMQAADNPEFKAPRSSGTAENLQLTQTLDEAAGAMGDLAAGNPVQALGAAGKLAAPAVVGMSQMGEGAMFQGAFNPNVPLRTLGQGTGRSMLDELLYPFVGADDERPVVK